MSFDGSFIGDSDDIEDIISTEFDGTMHLIKDKISPEINEIKVFVAIYSAGQGSVDGKSKFGTKCNFSITLLEYPTKKTLFHFRYNYGFEGKDTIELGTFLRNNDTWSFCALGKTENGAMYKILETYL